MTKLDQGEDAFVMLARSNNSSTNHEWYYIYSFVAFVAKIYDPTSFIPNVVDGSNYSTILDRVNKSVGTTSRYYSEPGAVRYNLNDLVARLSTPLFPPPALDAVEAEEKTLARANTDGEKMALITELSIKSAKCWIALPRPFRYDDIFCAKWAKELSEHPELTDRGAPLPILHPAPQALGCGPLIQSTTAPPAPSTQARGWGAPLSIRQPAPLTQAQNPGPLRTPHLPSPPEESSDDETLTDDD